MDPELDFRTDLYKGTAPYYDRYRKPYPAALLDGLFHRSGAPDGRGRLLDLACGTGQIAIPLAPRFDAVVAVDQEAESVAFGRAKSTELRAENIDWIVGSAETMEFEERFDLITIGNAFQRLKRVEIASRMRSWLVPGGCVALVWGDMPWVGDLDWQQALMQLFVDWVSRMGVEDRVPAGFEKAMEQVPHEEVLRSAGFDYAGKFELSVDHEWSVEELTGYIYSTSLLNRAVLGDRAREFETDLDTRLRRLGPAGRFKGPTSYAYELAFAPAR